MGIAQKVRSLPGYDLLLPLMNSRSTDPLDAKALARAICDELRGHAAVLDLGCGEGATAELFAAINASGNWAGVDIEGSPEVLARKRQDARISTFDGINLPFPSGTFDVVFSEQVFEHVQRPYELMAEVSRVLKAGGYFVGSVSYLEPYHSMSTFNFTPYGMKQVIESAGMECVSMQHSSDFLYKTFRQMLGGGALVSKFYHRSALFALFDMVRAGTDMTIAECNLLKIQYCGNFTFLARRGVGD